MPQSHPEAGAARGESDSAFFGLQLASKVSSELARRRSASTENRARQILRLGTGDDHSSGKLAPVAPCSFLIASAVAAGGLSITGTLRPSLSRRPLKRPGVSAKLGPPRLRHLVVCGRGEADGETACQASPIDHAQGCWQHRRSRWRWDYAADRRIGRQRRTGDHGRRARLGSNPGEPVTWQKQAPAAKVGPWCRRPAYAGMSTNARRVTPDTGGQLPALPRLRQQRRPRLATAVLPLGLSDCGMVIPRARPIELLSAIAASACLVFRTSEETARRRLGVWLRGGD